MLAPKSTTRQVLSRAITPQAIKSLAGVMIHWRQFSVSAALCYRVHCRLTSIAEYTSEHVSTDEQVLSKPDVPREMSTKEYKSSLPIGVWSVQLSEEYSASLCYAEHFCFSGGVLTRRAEQGEGFQMYEMNTRSSGRSRR